MPINGKHPAGIVQQAEEHGERAEKLFANLFAGHGLMPRAEQQFLALINSTTKMAFLNGWDAAIGKLDDADER